MLQKKFRKLLCLLLAIFTVLSLVACNNDNGNDPEQSTEASTTPPPPSVSFVPTQDCVIIRGDLYSSEENIADACFYLKMALKEVYGITAKIETDTVPATGDRCEFLVGVTNRTPSKKTYALLSLNDYSYNVSSKTSIVMCGGTPAKTYEAVMKFCEDVLTYNGKTAETKNVELKTRTKFEKFETYEYSTVTVNGILLEDYTLAVSSGADVASAVELNKQLGMFSGQVLPIRHVSELTGNEESIIRVGASYRTGKGANKLNGYIINNYVDGKGNVICFNASSKNNYLQAYGDFFSKVKKDINGNTVAFTVKEETTYSVAVTDTFGENSRGTDYTHWELSLEKTQELSDGLTYIEQIFYDSNGLPYRTYALIIDPEKYSFDLGTANDGYEYTLPDRSTWQSTDQHMQAAIKNGKNAVAGINADFFHNGSDGGDCRPWGLTIKNGQVISMGELEKRPLLNGTTGNVRPFFGVTKDGKALIAMESEYSDSLNIQMAVGGAYILCEEGKTTFFKNQPSIIHGGVHPRTVVGFREDGTVIMLVIDGRQESHSNGASLLQCSLLMHRFGASDALLLDGGGSSDMVLRDPKTDVYTTVNKPSDGQLRKIANSILVIAK